mgnify:CR=1 FL=1
MLKAKKLFLSIMVVSIFVIGIFSLTSCNKGDDSGKIIDKENFSTIKNLNLKLCQKGKTL